MDWYNERTAGAYQRERSDLSVHQFLLLCGPQDSIGHQFSDDKGRRISIRIPASSSRPALDVEVSFSRKGYKRGESSGYYFLEDIGAHIFILGMVFLAPDQRAGLGSDIAQVEIDEDHVPYLFRAGGIKELQKLSGEYNIIIVDTVDGDICCVSSRLGLLPLFYAAIEGALYVSDSLGSLGQASGQNELDLAVVAQLCLYNYSLTNCSLLKGCYCLPAGSCLRFTGGRNELSTYWDPEQLLHKDIIRGNNATDLIDAAFQDAIKRYAGQVEHTALSLTGGWDGRLVLAYILENMSPDQLQLYSFGTAESQDVLIPRHIARGMSLNYKPYILDEEYLESAFVPAARDAVMHSDGYRSIQRAHYLYAMQDLATNHTSLISGICGSNVMKAAATTPSVVLNKRILQLLTSSDAEPVILQHLAELKKDFAPEFDELDQTDFQESVMSPELVRALQQESYSQKASCFVFGILERKYFGPELASYKHLIGNFSPFIDAGFIDALSQTEYFNANRVSDSIFGNKSNAILYAKLMWRHNSRLAAFPSDKYVKLTDLLHPAKYPLVAAKQVYRRLIRRHLKYSNPYNTDDTLRRFIGANPSLSGLEALSVDDKNMLGSLVTALYWHRRSFSQAEGQS